MINEYSTRSSVSVRNTPITANCKEHDQTIKFVCTSPSCWANALLCADCLVEHRQHKWQSLVQFHNDLSKLLTFEDSSTVQRLNKSSKSVQHLLKRFKKRINGIISQLQEKTCEKINNIKHNYQLLEENIQVIDEKNIETMLRLRRNLRKQNGQGEWIQSMNKCIQQSVSETENKLVKIIKDLQWTLEVDWQKRTETDNSQALAHFKESFIQTQILEYQDNQYFRFHQDLKHNNIGLSGNNLVVTYLKNTPNRPAAVTSSVITSQKNKFVYQIVKLTTTAIFFPDTTIMIGVCIPNIVKAAGFRRISEINKGSFLIGSTGWTYHHSNLDYDRKNSVGWSFGEGDRIEVEVNLEGNGQIKFKKIGVLFDSYFLMPLNLDKNQLASLKPCVTFDSDEGAIVKIMTL